MSVTGTVKQGVIVLPPNLKLPEGVEVEVMVPEQPTTFAERYSAYVGAATDLPADLAENLDAYVHGRREK